MRDDPDSPESQFDIDALLARAHAGDRAAGAKVYERYLPWMAQRAKRILAGAPGLGAQTGDILQQALLGMIVSPPNRPFRTESRFKAYLHRTLENSLKSMVSAERSQKRDGRRQQGLHTGMDPVTDHRLDKRPSPVTDAELREEAELIRRAKEQLSENDQELMRLRSEKLLRWDVIASRMDGSPDALRMQYSRAVASLDVIVRRLRSDSTD